MGVKLCMVVGVYMHDEDEAVIYFPLVPVVSLWNVDFTKYSSSPHPSRKIANIFYDLVPDKAEF